MHVRLHAHQHARVSRAQLCARPLPQWKNRMHNERTGLPGVDISGATASVALIWCPDSDIHLTEPRPCGSRKKQSELRLMYDLGCRKPPAHAVSNEGSARSGKAPADASSRVQHAARDDSTAAHGAAHADRARGAAADDGASARALEDVRISRAAELRKVGELFLKAGNLREARSHFARAEALLGMDAAKYNAHRQAIRASALFRISGLSPSDSFL